MTTSNHFAASPRRLTSLRFGLVLVVSTVAVFTVVTTEFVIVGLIPQLMRDLGISTAQAGSLISVFALSAAVFGPGLTLATRRVERRHLLSGLVVVFSAINVLAAVVPSFWTLALARVAQGSVLPVFVSAASVTVAELAEAGRGGRAVAFLNYGVAAATVLGIPMGTFLANVTRWPNAFLGLGLLGVVSAGTLLAIVPRLIPRESSSLAGQIRLLRQPMFVAHLFLSVTMFSGMFAGYSYLGVFLHEGVGLGGRVLSGALLGFGLAGILGNWVAGRVVDRDPLIASGVNAAILGVAMALTTATALPLLVYVAGAIWGIAHMASFAFNQVRVLSAGRAAPTFAAALHISACNAGIALGATTGGFGATHFGVQAAGLGGGVVALISALIALGLVIWRRRSRRAARVEASPDPAVHEAAAACACGIEKPTSRSS